MHGAGGDDEPETCRGEPPASTGASDRADGTGVGELIQRWTRPMRKPRMTGNIPTPTTGPGTPGSPPPEANGGSSDLPPTERRCGTMDVHRRLLIVSPQYRA